MVGWDCLSMMHCLRRLFGGMTLNYEAKVPSNLGKSLFQFQAFLVQQ